MPYKDPKKQKEAIRKATQKYRKVSQEGITEGGITKNNDVIPEMVPPLGTLPERPRFKTLSDGQVLDRANPPKMTKKLTEIKSWEAANRADQSRMSSGGSLLNSLVDNRKKLAAICASLENRGLLKEVRYGVNGPTFNQVTEMLEVTQ